MLPSIAITSFKAHGSYKLKEPPACIATLKRRQQRGLLPNLLTVHRDRHSDGASSPVPRASSPMPLQALESSRSEASLELEHCLLELADSGESGAVRFRDFAWLHCRLIAAMASEMSSERLSQVGGRYPQQAFWKFDADRNGILDPPEWRLYAESLMQCLGKNRVHHACKTIMSLLLNGRSMGRYNNHASRQLLEKVTFAHHLSCDHLDLLKAVLEKHADPNFTDAWGTTIMCHAVTKCEPSIAALLLEFGGSASQVNRHMDSPILAAARARQREVLQLLLFGENAIGEEEGPSVGTSAMLVERMVELSGKEVRELLATADINYKSAFGWTPLIAAAFWGRRDCVECLVSVSHAATSRRLQLEANDRDSRGRNALHIAARKGFSELVPLLLAGKANVNMQDSEGWTALHHAVFNHSGASVSALVDGNADVSIRDKSGITAHMLASKDVLLSDRALRALHPSESVHIGLKIMPILKDESMSPYDKLDALMNLSGTCGSFAKLRIWDQLFHVRSGPNKAAAKRLWTMLGFEMLGRLRSERCDISPRSREGNEDCILPRIRMQQRFLDFLLAETAGPQISSEWPWDSREGFGNELDMAVRVQLHMLRCDCDAIWEVSSVMPGGQELEAMPADDHLLPQYSSQLEAHGLPQWLDVADGRGAFEAIRDMKKSFDDRAALKQFMDMASGDADFSTGSKFWQNIYKAWLAHQAQLADADFQVRLKKLAAAFNDKFRNDGYTVLFESLPAKTFEEMQLDERDFGQPGHKTLAERAVASKLADVVQSSMTVNCPAAAVALLRFVGQGKEPSEGSKPRSLELVRIRRPQGLGGLLLTVAFDCGLRNRPRLLGTIEVLLPELRALKDRAAPLLKHLKREARRTMNCFAET